MMADRMGAEMKALKKRLNERLHYLNDMYLKTGEKAFMDEYNALGNAYNAGISPESFQVLSPYMSKWLRDYSSKWLDK